jgi:hypothetical protein
MKLIDLSGKKFMSKASVPAGDAATVELGVLNISQGIAQPDGDTSKTEFPSAKYKTTGKQQGVPSAKHRS